MEKIIKSKITMIVSILVALVINIFVTIKTTEVVMETLGMSDSAAMLPFTVIGAIIGLVISYGVVFLVQMLIFNAITGRKMPSKADFFTFVCIDSAFTAIFGLIILFLDLSKYTWITLINPLYFLCCYMIYNFYTESEGYDKKKVLIYLAVIYVISIALTLIPMMFIPAAI